jgi:hypothetical protein
MWNDHKRNVPLWQSEGTGMVKYNPRQLESQQSAYRFIKQQFLLSPCFYKYSYTF